MAGFRVTIPLSSDLHQQQQQQSQAPAPLMSEARPPPQHQLNSAGVYANENMNMPVTGNEHVKKKRGRGRPRKHALVSGETSLALAPAGPFTMSQPSGTFGSLALASAGPFTVSQPSGTCVSLALASSGPSLMVSHHRGSGGEASLSLVPGGPSFTVSNPRVRGGRVKKMRGRGPPSSSSGNKDKLEASGSSGVGDDFTPHVLTILPGEDIAAKLMDLNINGSRSVCVLSAFGCISKVNLHHSTTSCGTIAYEGLFEIVSLTGSFTPMEMNGHKSWIGGLSISLSMLDNSVFGGSVVGPLVAATRVQIVAGSLVQEVPTQGLMASNSPQFRSVMSESSDEGEHESP